MATCKNHPDREVKAHGLCSYCYNSKRRKENPKVKKQDAAYSRAYHRRHAEKISKKMRAKRSTPGYILSRRKYKLRKFYGLTVEEFEAMVKRQGGRCEICGKRAKLVIDHSHERHGKVRDLLCNNCNLALGHMKDDPQILLRAVKYLQKHSVTSGAQ